MGHGHKMLTGHKFALPLSSRQSKPGNSSTVLWLSCLCDAHELYVCMCDAERQAHLAVQQVSLGVPTMQQAPCMALVWASASCGAHSPPPTCRCKSAPCLSSLDCDASSSQHCSFLSSFDCGASSSHHCGSLSVSLVVCQMRLANSC